MGHLFISYSHQEKAYVHELAAALQARGFEVWIDDRIDYGSRWPVVIEAAIDNCEGFILVASNNSHESEWVHNEMARAQRLKKRIFPLLLSGEPWISFESTQYFDVRDGKLPDETLYRAIQQLTNQRFEYFRNVAAHFWPVYENKEYGFSVRYPKEGTLSEFRDSYIQIDMPKVHGTNLDERTLIIHFRNDGNFPELHLKGHTMNYQSSYVDILGLRFFKESGQEGGMSRWHEVVSYSIKRGQNAVSLYFHLSTYSPDVFGLGPEVIVEIDRVAAKEILSYVVSSFTWLE